MANFAHHYTYPYQYCTITHDHFAGYYWCRYCRLFPSCILLLLSLLQTISLCQLWWLMHIRLIHILLPILHTITHGHFCRLLHISLPILQTITHGHFADYYSCPYCWLFPSCILLLMSILKTITHCQLCSPLHISFTILHTITHGHFADYYSCPYCGLFSSCIPLFIANFAGY